MSSTGRRDDEHPSSGFRSGDRWSRVPMAEADRDGARYHPSQGGGGAADHADRELQHRIKNTLAMVSAIATQTLRGEMLQQACGI